jgi:hypothetical protein
MAKKMKVPYDDRSDLEKIRSQWNKIKGLHSEQQSSAAIVRCATAAEIAANLAIRSEFSSRSTFDPSVVNKFLEWANGLNGKVNRLLLILCFNNDAKDKNFKKLSGLAGDINGMRNAIVHSGNFSKAVTAAALIAKAKDFIETVVGVYEPGYKLPEKKSSSRSSRPRT